MKKLLLIVLMAVGVVGTVFLLKPTAQKVNAQAGTGVNSRPELTGYYSNVGENDLGAFMPTQTRFEPYGYPPPGFQSGGLESAFTSPDNFTNLDQFVKLIHRMLFVESPADDWFACVGHQPVVYGDGGPYSDPCIQRKMGAQWASYLINTQLGKNGNDFAGCSNPLAPDPWDNWFCGLDYARNNFSAWQTRINYYAGQGWIEWHAPVSFPPDHLNTLNGWYGEDSFRFTQGGAEFAWSIVFHNPPTPSNPAGSLYIIKKWCGNITGEATPIVTPPSGDVVNADCNAISGWAYDPKNYTNGYITQIKVYKDAPGGFGGTLVAGTPMPADDPGPGGQSPYPGTVNNELNEPISVSGNHGFSVDISGLQDINPHTYYVMAVADNGQEFPLHDSPVSLPACKVSACSQLTLRDQASSEDLNGKPEPAAPFSAQFGVTLSAPPGPFGSYKITAGPASPPVASGNVVYNENGGLSTTVPNIVVNTPGVYNFHWDYKWTTSGVTQTRSCDATIQVANRPYFQVYGNDISAGGNFDTASNNCSSGAPPFPDATIIAYARNTGGSYRGAGAEFAAQALGSITEFFSAAGGANPPSPPTGLTFANYNGSSVMPGFGGNSAMPTCAANYYGNASKPGVAAAGGPVASLADGARRYSGSVTVGGTVALGAQAAIYVDGDVVITSDITFAPGPYNNREDIPSLFIVASGNIYISKDVHRIDGFYIAQPKTAAPADPTGNIYTCAINDAGTWRPPNSVEIYDQCGGGGGGPLIINGAFTAKKIHFLRTNGTVHNGGGDSATSFGNIAEVFNFTPELYMALPDGSLSVPGSRGGYNSITSLPPIL